MYSAKMNFETFSGQIQSRGNALQEAIRQGKILYDKWYALTYGLSTAEIIALPQFNVASETITEADVNALNYALGVFNTIASGSALTPATRDAYLTPFL